MAISGSAIWNKTGGSDNAGGGFDPSLSANMYADLAGVLATSSVPCVNSASYVSVVGDIGDWLFAGVKSGWYAGWYKILSLGVFRASVAAGGTGYTVGDILTIVGGTGVAATVKVATLGGSNAVATIVAITAGNGTPGAYSVSPGTSAIATTGGTGTGCTLNLTFGYNLDAAITSTTVNNVTTTLGKAQSLDVLQTGGAYQTYALNGKFYTLTTIGCNSSASPSAGIWAIDRSRRSAIFWNGTNGSTNAAGTAFTFGAGGLPAGYVAGKQDIGNIIQVLSGSGGGAVTASMYAISQATSTVWTIDRSAGTSSTGVAFSLGGTFATIGGFGAQYIKASVTAIGQHLYLSGKETITSASANVANGVFNSTSINSLYIQGFSATFGDMLPSAYLTVSGITSATMISKSVNGTTILEARNIVFDGANLSAVLGFSEAQGGRTLDCLFVNFNFAATVANYAALPVIAARNYFYNCNIPTFNLLAAFDCISDTCATTFITTSSAGLAASRYVRCVSYNTSTTGFSSIRHGSFLDCVAYQGAASGFAGLSVDCYLENCLAVSSGAFGFGMSDATIEMVNCAAYNNTSGNIQNTSTVVYNFKTLTGDPFSGNHIGGNTDLAVNSSNNTWVTSAGSAFTVNDIGLNLYIYGGTNWTPGIYQIINFDSGTSSAILNFSPATTSTTGGSWRIADFRINNVSGAGASLRGAGAGPIGQVNGIDISAVEHVDAPGAYTFGG